MQEIWKNRNVRGMKTKGRSPERGKGKNKEIGGFFFVGEQPKQKERTLRECLLHDLNHE
jgi:hypothetical protein